MLHAIDLLEQHLSLLSSALTDLDAAGEGGFEGLIRDVFVEVTGMDFQLAKSGHQGGSDVRSAPSNTFAVGMEAKRYRPSTRLPVDQLKAKIVDAAHQANPVDLWTLAATREISATDREALHDAGEQLGIKILVYDWPEGQQAFPALAVLLASAPIASAVHLGTASASAEALEAVRADPRYPSVRERALAELMAADVGFACAGQATWRWLLEAQQSEPNARSRLGGFNNLKSEGVIVAARPQIHKALDAWWLKGGSSLALLGDEGVGKTWAALDWLDAFDRATSPLILFVPAREVEGRDPDGVMARALAQQTGLRNEAFWRRRLHLWRSGDANGRILLIIDGLNQNWSKTDWADLLQPLYEDAWKNRVNVLMTCWPETWSALGALAPLTPAPEAFKVAPFTDEELDDFLHARGHSRADFSDAVLELMRVPRLSLLALDRRNDLERSGDITAERLAYEDWKHRVSQGSARPDFTDEDFKAFIAELGRDLTASVDTLSLSRRKLLDKLGRDSGAADSHLSVTVSEIIAGRWLEPGKQRHHFKVNTALAPFALGLALASEVRDSESEAAAQARIAEFLDPFKGQSLAVSILRAATTAALLDNTTRPGRRALVERWVTEQNFARADFDAWWRVMGCDIHLFCDLAESLWLDRRDRGGLFTDEVLIKGFANACDFPEVAAEMQVRITRWLGWVWSEPEYGRSMPEQTLERLHTETVTGNLELWRKQPDRAFWPTIELRDSGNVSWLSHRVFGIMSYGKVEPFAPALVAWCLSRSILGKANHFQEAAWLLRLNSRDPGPVRATLLEAVDRLTGHDDQLRLRAAIWLLQALGDETSAQRAADLNARFPASVLLEEPGLAPADCALDPQAEATPVDLKELAGADLWRGARSPTDKDLRFAQLCPLLARNNPPALRELVGAAADSASARTPDELHGLVLQTREMLLPLSEAERQALATALKTNLEKDSLEDEWPEQWQGSILQLQLWDKPATEQWEILREAGLGSPMMLDRVQTILTRPGEDEIPRLMASLPHEDWDPEAIACGLAYLQRIDLEPQLAEWEALARFVLHEHDGVRRSALKIAADSGHLPALRAFADSGWTSTAGASREDRAYGSIALSRAADLFNEPILLDRADPEVFGWRLSRAPGDARSLLEFEAFLKKAIMDLDERRERSFPQYAWHLHQPMTVLLERRRDEVLRWLAPWIRDRRRVPNWTLHDSFPLTDLAEALMPQNTELGMKLWRLLQTAQREGIFKNAAINVMPLSAGTIDSEIGKSLLENLHTDEALRNLAHTAILREKSDWLAEVICVDVASPEPARIARGWMLLGYTDGTAPFIDLWNDLTAPEHGWLASVHRSARILFDRNIWARHWGERFLAADNAADAYAAFQLLRGSMDNRIGLWMQGDALHKAGRGPYWSTMRAALEKTVKGRRQGLDRTLFGSDIMKYTQAPWL